MKHKVLKNLIVASVVTSIMIALTPVGASAAWVKNYYGNWSYTEGYSYATGWREISGTWYFFDDFGQMRTGWIYSSGEWYYADLSGANLSITIVPNLFIQSKRSNANRKLYCKWKTL